MLQGINVEEIKKYNESLRTHKDRASKLRAEIDFNTTELDRICAELTIETGLQVTPLNLEQIYNDRVSKINNTLETGKEILKRIAEEEAANASAPIQPTAVPQQVQPGPAPVFAQGGSNGMFSNLDGGTPNVAFNNGSIQI